MKQVMFLIDKHRRDMWVDDEDDVWFYDLFAGYWQVLAIGVYGFDQPNTGAEGDFEPTSRFGPYRRIWKSPR